MGSGKALLIGCALIAVAITIHAFLARPPKYQIAYVSPGILARVDTRTGALDFCGNIVHILEAFFPDEADYRAAGFSDAEIEEWKADVARKHCFPVNFGH